MNHKLAHRWLFRLNGHSLRNSFPTYLRPVGTLVGRILRYEWMGCWKRFFFPVIVRTILLLKSYHSVSRTRKNPTIVVSFFWRHARYRVCKVEKIRTVSSTGKAFVLTVCLSGHVSKHDKQENYYGQMVRKSFLIAVNHATNILGLLASLKASELIWVVKEWCQNITMRM